MQLLLGFLGLIYVEGGFLSYFWRNLLDFSQLKRKEEASTTTAMFFYVFMDWFISVCLNSTIINIQI
eukprot:m.367718 g.367718  ORF g.367718 m.367718 type:complete len:67 (+) comp42248_c0_seq1:38-238(+)